MYMRTECVHPDGTAVSYQGLPGLYLLSRQIQTRAHDCNYREGTGICKEPFFKNTPAVVNHAAPLPQRTWNCCWSAGAAILAIVCSPLTSSLHIDLTAGLLVSPLKSPSATPVASLQATVAASATALLRIHLLIALKSAGRVDHADSCLARHWS